MDQETAYPEYIMEAVRQRMGYDEDDTSYDDEIAAMTKDAVFNEVCNWDGLIHYGPTIRDWVRDIYGIDFNEFQD